MKILTEAFWYDQCGRRIKLRLIETRNREQALLKKAEVVRGLSVAR